MISFQQICEWQTMNQRYTWFLIPSNLVDLINVDDKAIVFFQSMKEPEWIRVWYPRENFFTRKMEPEERIRLIQQAIDNGEIEVIIGLKKGMG